MTHVQIQARLRKALQVRTDRSAHKHFLGSGVGPISIPSNRCFGFNLLAIYDMLLDLYKEVIKLVHAPSGCKERSKHYLDLIIIQE